MCEQVAPKLTTYDSGYIYVRAKFTDSNQTRYYIVPPSQRGLITRGDLIITSLGYPEVAQSDVPIEYSKICFAQVVDVLGGVPESYRHPVIPFVMRIDQNYLNDGIREAAEVRRQAYEREKMVAELQRLAAKMDPAELARLLSLSGNNRAEEIYELLR